MKRYRVLNDDFDTRPYVLSIEILDTWEPRIKEQWERTKAQIEAEVEYEYGKHQIGRKLQDFKEMGPKPFSVVAYHNRFLAQIRSAFVLGDYYPALTGACALGERILNHLLLRLREDFKSTREYRKVYRKDSFDNWDLAIGTLHSWKVLTDACRDAFEKLKTTRHSAIHFSVDVDKMDRELSLRAIHELNEVINTQFASHGHLPWFIEGTENSFIKKEYESNPFVREVYLPNCVLVSPFHELEARSRQFVALEHKSDAEGEVSDQEYARLHKEFKERRVSEKGGSD